MPTTPQDILERKIEIYRKIFVEQFIREFNFLGDVVAGRATAKGDFTDKICSVVTFALTTVVDNSGIPFLGGVVDQVIGATVGAVSDKLKEKKQETIGKLYDMVDQEELHILIERVALEATKRYEFFMAAELSDNPIEGVIPFAKAGVERALEFIARKDLDLNEENLLQGLIEGRSGAYISGYSNTSLVSKNKKEGKKDDKLTAEGVYGRSAFRKIEDNSRWILPKAEAKQKQHVKLTKEEVSQRLDKLKKEVEDSKAKHHKLNVLKQGVNFLKSITKEQVDKLSESLHDYGFSKLTKEGEPKYGYAQVADSVIQHYGYKPEVKKPGNNLALSLEMYPPRTKIVSRKDVEAYLAQLKQPKSSNNNSPTISNFNDYIASQSEGVKVAICRDNLSGLILDGADFSNCDFSGADLTGCSAKNTNFSNATFYKTNLTNIKAAQADFSRAHLEYVIGQQADFSAANFTQAHLNFAQLKGASLPEIAQFGSTWVGADLTEIKTKSADIKQVKKVQEKEVKEKNEQFAEALKASVTEQGMALKKLTEDFNQQLSSLSEKTHYHSGKVEEILTQLTQESQLRETFATHFTLELTQLRQQAKSVKSDELSGKITLIEKQLITLQQQQQELPSLIGDIKQLMSTMTEKDLSSKDLKKLDQNIAALKTHAEEFSEGQRAQLNELQSKIWVEIESLRLIVDEHTQKIEALTTRVQTLELKQQQPQSISAVTPFWQPPSGASVSGSKAEKIFAINEKNSTGIAAVKDSEASKIVTISTDELSAEDRKSLFQ